MTIDELIDLVCPFQKKTARRIFTVGFKYGTTWWFLREKLRHGEDITRIDIDLLRLGESHGVDVSKIAEYIDI